MKPELRACTTADVELLQQLARKTYSDAFGHLNTKDSMHFYLTQAFDREKLLAELKDEHSLYYFLYVGTQLAGYLKLNEAPSQSDINDPDSLEIERIYVDVPYQGRGLGRFLIEHAFSVARELSKHRVWLGVWERNASALRLYSRLGFRPVGRHPFRMGDELQSDLILRLDVEHSESEEPKGHAP